MANEANGAKTEFVFVSSREWKDIYKSMACEHCLRTGVVKVEKDGVVIMCTRSTRKAKAAKCRL